LKKQNNKLIVATKTIAFSALLAAISVVMARLFAFAPVPEMRFSLDKFPLFLSGLFFGPVVGALTGFVADFVGCLLSPYGFNPFFILPAILYGLFGGLLRHYVAKNSSIFRLAVSYLFPVVLGSVLYQSAALAWVYASTTFMEAFITHLGTRGIQFTITLVLEVSVIFLLLQTRLFHRLGVWPPKRKEIT